MTTSAVRVAAVQLASGSDVQLNIETAADLVLKAADDGARYIQLPEYFNYLGPEERYSAVAETIPGKTTTQFAEIARSRGVAIHIGSMLEESQIPGRSFNTGVVIDENGSLVAKYRKAHLFDVDVQGEVVYRESDSITPGDELIVTDVSGFCLGMSICFDLRFPEMYRRLATNGAQVIAIPAAFAASTGRAHWNVLVRARAIENHAFVVAAAQVGTTAEGSSFHGHSVIIDPWGDVLAESLEEGGDVIAATIDLNEVMRRRSQISVLTLQRPALYDSLPNSVAGV
jgi:deaminated glutathione amidase